MFSSILKDKIEIEERVRKLQNNYINAIKLRKFENKSEEEDEENQTLTENNHEKRQVKDIIEEKQNNLSEIYANYETVIKSYEQLSTLIKEQREVTLEIYEIIKSTLTKLNIQILDEFKLTNEEKVTAFLLPEIKISTSANQLNDINGKNMNKNNKESDKENFKV